MSGSLCCSQPAPSSSCRLLNPDPPTHTANQLQRPLGQGLTKTGWR